jgi:hypothetical protein
MEKETSEQKAKRWFLITLLTIICQFYSLSVIYLLPKIFLYPSRLLMSSQPEVATVFGYQISVFIIIAMIMKLLKSVFPDVNEEEIKNLPSYKLQGRLINNTFAKMFIPIFGLSTLFGYESKKIKQIKREYSWRQLKEKMAEVMAGIVSDRRETSKKLTELAFEAENIGENERFEKEFWKLVGMTIKTLQKEQCRLAHEYIAGKSYEHTLKRLAEAKKMAQELDPQIFPENFDPTPLPEFARDLKANNEKAEKNHLALLTLLMVEDGHRDEYMRFTADEAVWTIGHVNFQPVTE